MYLKEYFKNKLFESVFLTEEERARRLMRTTLSDAAAYREAMGLPQPEKSPERVGGFDNRERQSEPMDFSFPYPRVASRVLREPLPSHTPSTERQVTGAVGIAPSLIQRDPVGPWRSSEEVEAMRQIQLRNEPMNDYYRRLTREEDRLPERPIERPRVRQHQSIENEPETEVSREEITQNLLDTVHHFSRNHNISLAPEHIEGLDFSNPDIRLHIREISRRLGI